MTKVLLLSDTHGYIDENILSHAGEADEVWHAGDIGTSAVTDALRTKSRLRAVYGNIDGGSLRNEFAELLAFEVEGVHVHMRHIGGYPPRYAKGVRAYLLQHPCDLFICGHSHILKVMRDDQPALLHMNPGAAGKHGFHQVRTMLRFSLAKGRVEDLEVIEMQPRR